MRELLHCIVAASSQASALNAQLMATRTSSKPASLHLQHLQLHPLPTPRDELPSPAVLRGSSGLFAQASTPAGVSAHGSTLAAGKADGKGDGGIDAKRERECNGEGEEDMAIKVLAARAAAQNEKARRKAAERKLRACARLTPKRAASARGSPDKSRECSSPAGEAEQSRSDRGATGHATGQLSLCRQARGRSAWKPYVTPVLQKQSGGSSGSGGTMPWHIEVKS